MCSSPTIQYLYIQTPAVKIMLMLLFAFVKSTTSGAPCPLCRTGVRRVLRSSQTPGPWSGAPRPKTRAGLSVVCETRCLRDRATRPPRAGPRTRCVQGPVSGITRQSGSVVEFRIIFPDCLSCGAMHFSEPVWLWLCLECLDKGR